MPSDHVIRLCTSQETVTDTAAANPSKSIDDVAQSLSKSIGHEHDNVASARDRSIITNKDHSDLDKAAACGKFPSRPSDLFLKIYNDVLACLDRDPLAGLVSPPLLGSSGVIPLSIVSVIPDIMHHYAQLIVTAQSEVFIATNYWEPSHAATIVTDALRELSRRVQARQPPTPPVIVKMMYDRGTPKQAVKNHSPVKPEDWGKVGLPNVSDIPGINLEVLNYHRPPLGTFHAKYLVVDRKVACLNSNNIQDRPNLEMMVQLEGPIVESFYDMALLSWSNAMNPPLPLLSHPPTHSDTYAFKRDNPYLKYIKEDFAPATDGVHDQADSSVMNKITERLNCSGVYKATANVTEEDIKDHPTFVPHIFHSPHTPVPIVMVNRNPTGTPGHQDTSKFPQDVAWLSAIKHAQNNIFIQSPTFNASPVVPAILDACRRGVQVTIYVSLGYNDQGEMIPFQGGTNEAIASTMYKTLNEEGKDNAKNLSVHWYTAKDQKKPLGASEKKRSSHVKFMAVDGQIVIQGNGNQGKISITISKAKHPPNTTYRPDTQSWFHSQEINVLVDSPALTHEMISGINANQNTAQCGRVDPADGVWRDGVSGETVQSSGTATAGPLGYLKGFAGAIARVRGTGGF